MFQNRNCDERLDYLRDRDNWQIIFTAEGVHLLKLKGFELYRLEYLTKFRGEDHWTDATSKGYLTKEDGYYGFQLSTSEAIEFFKKK